MPNRDALPEVEPRYRRLNVEEPYRLFLTCVDVRLQLTEERIRIVQATASPLPRKASLTNDTRNYQQFRSQFR